MEIYGHIYKKDEIRKRIGDISQIGGIKLVEFKEGVEKGVEGLEFRTGSGFNFTVLPSRGLDISNAEFNGIPLAYISSTGVTHPAYYESEGYGWLRGFFGGLLTTCGLTYCGAPCVDEGVSLGLHGRVSNLPAHNVNTVRCWQDDEFILGAKGEVRETVVFGENVVMRREISTKIGSKRLFIEDVVENEGFESTPHQMLYHINLGFPIVSENSVLLSPSILVMPRDKEAEKDKENYWKFQLPVKGYKEKVYYHKMEESNDGFVTVAVVNREFNNGRGLGVYVKYLKETLPFFIEWKMMGEGLYVVGLEPANTLVEGRAKERKRGNLKILEAGEKVNYKLEIGVLTEKVEIETLHKKIK